jgi:transcriptional regulator with XRE-family HTH domain
VERGVRGSGIAVDPERVRRARIAAGLSLGGLAGTEVSRTFIFQIERGQARPSPAVLDMIARRTGKPIKYFLRATKSTITGQEISQELSEVATRVRRFMALGHLNPSEHDTMKLVEMSLRQGAAVARRVQTRSHQ